MKKNIYLNKREILVLKLISKGKTNIQIAEEIQVSVHTIKANISKIFYKLNAVDRTQAVIKAIKENLIDI